MRNSLLALFLTMLLPVSGQAGTVTAIDTDFSTLPSNFTLLDFSTDNATASIVLDEVDGSMGLVMRGTWTLAPGGDETSVGIYRPLLAEADEFDFDLIANDGIVSIGYTLDARLSGLPGDNVNRLFVQLIIYQQQDDGSGRSFTQFRNAVQLTPGSLQGFNVANLIASDFDDGSGGQPDFGPDARPMTFGLQLGGRLTVANNAPGDYIGGVDVDNWQLIIDSEVTIFEDGFE